MNYINRIGEIVRAYFAATGGMVTFFAPINEAFDRIPESVVRRLLRDRIWLEQVVLFHPEFLCRNRITDSQTTHRTRQGVNERPNRQSYNPTNGRPDSAAVFRARRMAAE